EAVAKARETRFPFEGIDQPIRDDDHGGLGEREVLRNLSRTSVGWIEPAARAAIDVVAAPADVPKGEPHLVEASRERGFEKTHRSVSLDERCADQRDAVARAKKRRVRAEGFGAGQGRDDGDEKNGYGTEKGRHRKLLVSARFSRTANRAGVRRGTA